MWLIALLKKGPVPGALWIFSDSRPRTESQETFELVETSVEKQRAVENAAIEAQEEENVSNHPGSSKTKKRKSKVNQSSTTSKKARKQYLRKARQQQAEKARKRQKLKKSKDTASKNGMETTYRITRETKLKNSKETKVDKRVVLISMMTMVSQKVAMKLVFSPRRIIMML